MSDCSPPVRIELGVAVRGMSFSGVNSTVVELSSVSTRATSVAVPAKIPLDSFAVATPNADGHTWDPVENANYRELGVTSDPYTALRAMHVAHPARIDFILLNAEIPRESIVSSRVVLTGTDGAAPSDHYGVLTTIVW